MTETTPRPVPAWEARPLLVPSLVVAVLSLLAALPMGSAFFTAFRVAVVCWAVLTVVHTIIGPGRNQGMQSLRVWPFLVAGVAAGVLWWPYTFTFPKPVWVAADVAFAVVAVAVGVLLRRDAGGKRRLPATVVTLLLVVVTVAGTTWLMHERAAADGDRQWCSQQDEQTQALHPRCGGGTDDGDVPGDDHYPG